MTELVAHAREDCPCDRRASGEIAVEGFCDECAQRGDWIAPHPMTEPDVTVREMNGREAELTRAVADHRNH